jgi:GH15 family glucan-1,4-alpha-glucosidase
MAYQPIENYGLIGNLRTVALVGMNGSIDWFCYPHIDSPSVFGAILDDSKGGRFQISAIADNIARKQSYLPSTNILVTRFLLADGIAELEDFMPVGLSANSPWYHHLYRRVRCVKGAVRMSVVCRPAFDYGRAAHQTHLNAEGATFKSSGLSMALSTTVPLRKDRQGGVTGEFVLEEGKTQLFLLRGCENQPTPHCKLSEEEAEELFQATVKYWQAWLASCSYRGRWREQVERSALALKLLTFEPTGAIAAAATTSLPEVIGGVRNWDYRFTWLRDAAFTVYGFVRIGFDTEATGFLRWMHDYASELLLPEGPLPALYTVQGKLTPRERVLSHLEGYRRSAPVRIGNGAASQIQMDVYGELLDALYLINKHVGPISYDLWKRIRERLDWICGSWRRPDSGIWEMRGRKRQFVYSKVMAWVALDRGIRLADKRSFPANRQKWIVERDRIYEEVMTRGWNEKRGAFTQFYGSTDLDAALLIMPLVFFMAPTDPKMLSTVDAIMRSPREGGLVSGNLVYRYPASARTDGLPGEEGTFNMCSFWLVEALTRASHRQPERLAQARIFFERSLGYSNHLGLYAEQTGPQGEALGNFPQAFSHLALISAAYNLNRALEGG